MKGDKMGKDIIFIDDTKALYGDFEREKRVLFGEVFQIVFKNAKDVFYRYYCYDNKKVCCFQKEGEDEKSNEIRNNVTKFNDLIDKNILTYGNNVIYFIDYTWDQHGNCNEAPTCQDFVKSMAEEIKRREVKQIIYIYSVQTPDKARKFVDESKSNYKKQYNIDLEYVFMEGNSFVERRRNLYNLFNKCKESFETQESVETLE